MQYMIIQQNLLKCKPIIAICCSFSSAFMTSKTTSGTIKHGKKPNQKVDKLPILVIFFLSSHGPVQDRMTPSGQFLH